MRCHALHQRVAGEKDFVAGLEGYGGGLRVFRLLFALLLLLRLRGRSRLSGRFGFAYDRGQAGGGIVVKRREGGRILRRRVAAGIGKGRVVGGGELLLPAAVLAVDPFEQAAVAVVGFVLQLRAPLPPRVGVEFFQRAAAVEGLLPVGIDRLLAEPQGQHGGGQQAAVKR